MSKNAASIQLDDRPQHTLLLISAALTNLRYQRKSIDKQIRELEDKRRRISAQVFRELTNERSIDETFELHQRTER